MNWLNSAYVIVSVIVSALGAVIAVIQLISPKEISRLTSSFTSFIRKRLPSLSSPLIASIGMGIIGAILAGAIAVLANYAFTSTTSQPPSNPPASPQYTTYHSTTDIHNFTTTLKWDTSAIVQQSMFIELNVQPNSNPSDIAKLSKKFGPGYTFFIVAQLDTDSTTFTAEPKDQMQQPIEQDNFSFHWIATPLHSGSQAVDFVIKGIWISQSNSNKQIEYYLGSHTWHISVADDAQIITLGQFNVSQILGYGGSVIVSVAFFQLITTSVVNRKQAKSQAAQTNQPPQPPASNQQNMQQPVP